MSLSKLSKLPPEVLSSVLNNRAMPLSRRLRLRLLSNRWADIIEDGLKKVTSLVIRDNNAAFHREPKPDDLVIQSTVLTDGFTRPLSRLFTSLTQLTLNFEVDTSWKAMPSLLAHLETANLTTLKLYGVMSPHELNETIPIANVLSSLTSLTLTGEQFSFLLPYFKPVFSRLEKFGYFDYWDDLADILSSRLSPRCTHLFLDARVFCSFSGALLAPLYRNLTNLHLVDCDNTVWESLSTMRRLDRLTLDFTNDTLDSSLFRHLGPFPRLTQVKLLFLSYRTPLALPSKKEKPLSTIKRLTLEVDFGYSPVDYQAFLQAIGAWFPALTHLTLITEPDINFILPFQVDLRKLPFSVEMVASYSVDTRLMIL